jgi:gliding motility-associated-like protein
VTVNNLNGVNASLTSVTDLTCFQSNDGEIVTGASGGNGPYTYSWTAPASSTNGTASTLPAGSFTLTVTDADGCISTVTATVTQPPQLAVTAAAASPSICAGQNVQVSGTAAGGSPGYSYLWTPGNISGNSQSISPTQSGQFMMHVTDLNGCEDSAAVSITVNPVPTADLSADVTSGCAPLCVQFADLTTISSPGVITSWSWDYGDGTSTSANPTHCYNTAGSYDVLLTVVSADGCSSTIAYPSYINVFAVPVASFTADPQPATMVDPVITFTDASSNASAWSWNFGDGTGTSTQQDPEYTYSEPTCYLVTLTVTSIDGCTDLDTQRVCIGPEAGIYVPNAFTPNDDGTNDVFIPVTMGIDPTQYQLWIYDRWGNLIFYTDDLSEGWNGNVQGHDEPCQIDTYVWKIIAVDMLYQKHNLLGRVSIIK